MIYGNKFLNHGILNEETQPITPVSGSKKVENDQEPNTNGKKSDPNGGGFAKDLQDSIDNIKKKEQEEEEKKKKLEEERKKKEEELKKAKEEQEKQE